MGFLLGLALLFSALPASAIMQGKTLKSAGSSDEELIQQTTIRYVVQNGSNSFKPFCSGVHIGPGEALGVQHCFSGRGRDISEGKIWAEFHDPSDPKKIRRLQVEATTSEKDGKSDFAVVRFKGEAPFKGSVPIAYGGCDKGSDQYVAGFGLDEELNAPSTVKVAKYSELEDSPGLKSQLIQQQRIDRGVDEVTERDFRKDKVSGDTMSNWVALKSKSGKICGGDSGGPIFCKSHGRLALSALSVGTQNEEHRVSHGRINVSDKVSCSTPTVMTAAKISKKAADLIQKNRMPAASSEATPYIPPPARGQR